MKKFLIFIVLVAVFDSCLERNQEVKEIERSDTVGTQLSERIPVPPKPIEEMSREERKLYKEELAKSGFYDCCVKPSCNMCFYEEGSQCKCGERVKKDEGVCGECLRGWQKGHGSVKGVDPKNVKRM